MQIDLAHLRERSTSGHPIDFAVFGARSNSGTQGDNERLLAQLTMKARGAGLKVDQAALAYNEHGRVRFFGSKHLVDYLAKSGVPRWTHKIDV